MTTQPDRRLVRWLLIAALGVAFLLLALLVCWYWLPRWAPGFVVEHSPWVEPLVRVRMHHPDVFSKNNELSQLCEERLGNWGEEAYPTLSWLLKGDPALRRAALESYPFIVPYARATISSMGPNARDSIVVHVKTVHEDGRQWWIVSCGGRDFESPAGDVGLLTELAGMLQVARERARTNVHPVALGRRVAELEIELRCDQHVPYRIVDGLMWLAKNGEKPGSAMIGYLRLTFRLEVYSPPPYEEYPLRVSLLPALRGAHVITMSRAGAVDPPDDVVIACDELTPVSVSGRFASEARHDAVVAAISGKIGGWFEPGARPPAITVRGSPDCRWADVMVAMAAVERAYLVHRIKADEYSPRADQVAGLLTLSPMATRR